MKSTCTFTRAIFIWRHAIKLAIRPSKREVNATARPSAMFIAHLLSFVSSATTKIKRGVYEKMRLWKYPLYEKMRSRCTISSLTCGREAKENFPVRQIFVDDKKYEGRQSLAAKKKPWLAAHGRRKNFLRKAGTRYLITSIPFINHQGGFMLPMRELPAEQMFQRTAVVDCSWNIAILWKRSMNSGGILCRLLSGFSNISQHEDFEERTYEIASTSKLTTYIALSVLIFAIVLFYHAETKTIECTTCTCKFGFKSQLSVYLMPLAFFFQAEYTCL